jgi:hypothetical protein
MGFCASVNPWRHAKPKEREFSSRNSWLQATNFDGVLGSASWAVKECQIIPPDAKDKEKIVISGLAT